MIRYEGPFADAGTVTFTDYDINKLKASYGEREKELTSLPNSPYSDNFGASLNFKGLEKLFFETLDIMNIDKTKVVLQRIEDDGTINSITLNNDGSTTSNPCPKS